MKQALTSISILIIGFVLSCSKSNNNDSSTNSEIWPLKINNEWAFSFTEYKEDGSVKSTSNYISKVTGDTLINGNKFYILGPLYLRNSDGYTVEAMGSSKVALPYLKKSEVDGNKYYTTTVTVYITGGSCIANTDYFSYTATTNINGYTCYKNEEIYKDCSGGIRSKIIKYFKPGVGLISVEKYNTTSGSSKLYLVTKDVLQNYKLN